MGDFELVELIGEMDYNSMNALSTFLGQNGLDKLAKALTLPRIPDDKEYDNLSDFKKDLLVAESKMSGEPVEISRCLNVYIRAVENAESNEGFIQISGFEDPSEQ